MSNARLWGLVVIHVTRGMAPGAGWADPWHTEKGLASYYGKGFAGRPTANGETFSPTDMTAAHRQLPLGTKVLVENLATRAQTEVKINDRGPYADTKRRILDLSRAAADSIGLVERGVGPVTLTVTAPAARPKTWDDADYTVQVGIFAEAEAAQDVLAQLESAQGGSPAAHQGETAGE